MDKDINKSFFKDIFSSKDSLNILDVGTYDGKDSLEFNKLFPNSKIYSFEADKRSIKLFKKIVKNTSNIHLIETALADVDGLISWYASDSETRRHYDFQNSWSASSSLKKPDNHLNIFKDISFLEEKKVKSIKLDTWIKLNPHIDKIDIMWVDVNGGEKEFIDGAIETLKNKVKYLYIEFNGIKDKTLYKDCLTLDKLRKKLEFFKELGIYNFQGNFGNILLKNKNEF